MNTTENATQTFTNTDDSAARNAFVALVNNGKVTTVNGRTVWTRFGAFASAWQNGSVSVDVRGKGKRTQGTVWVKVGETVTFS